MTKRPPFFVRPTDRASTRLLRALVEHGPQLRDDLFRLARVEMPAGPASQMLRNLRIRGRLRIVERLMTSGRPAIWDVTPEAREALAYGKGRPYPVDKRRRPGAINPLGRKVRRHQGPVIGSVPAREDLWRRARAAVPSNVPWPDCDDLISEIVVLLMEGESDMTVALKTARRRMRTGLGMKPLSLTAPIPGRADVCWIDLLATGEAA